MSMFYRVRQIDCFDKRDRQHVSQSSTESEQSVRNDSVSRNGQFNTGEAYTR